MAPLALFLLGLYRVQEVSSQVGLPAGFVETAAWLRKHGLGDPRGGVYCSTRVIGLPFWATQAPEGTRGWVFPDGRFVSREGLTYVGVRQTTPADLEADVQAEERRPRSWDTIAEAARRVDAAVLLTSGRPDLAGRLLATVPTNDPENADRQAVTRFILRRYSQAISAHVQGDDREARRIEAGLVEAAEEFDKTPRGVYLSWWPLAGIQALARETERRLAAPRPERPKDKAHRLIAELEDIGLTQRSLPGGVEFIDAVPVQRLIALGDQAVDPLLDCVEHDRRLTRSASFGQMESVEVETVEAAARTALFGILGVPVFASSDKEVTAASLRAYWTAHRHESPAARAFALLADDAQPPAIWYDAAERLFHARRLPHFFEPAAPIDRDLKLPDEAVRTPALANLLLRRARGFEEGLPGRPREYGVYNAARLGAMLTRVDRTRGLELLGRLTRAAGELLIQRGSSPTLEETIASGPRFRAAQGDPEAWIDYRAWLARRREKAGWLYEARSFMPLVERRNDPTMRNSAHDFFGPGSPWRPLAMAKAGLKPEFLFVSPLLALPVVREGVVELLQDRTPAESLVVTPDTGRFSVRKGGSWVLTPRPSDVPPTGTVVPQRLSDEFASRLANLDGTPEFHPWAPEATRDQELRALIRHVRAAGDRLYRGNP